MQEKTHKNHLERRRIEQQLEKLRTLEIRRPDGALGEFAARNIGGHIGTRHYRARDAQNFANVRLRGKGGKECVWEHLRGRSQAKQESHARQGYTVIGTRAQNAVQVAF